MCSQRRPEPPINKLDESVRLTEPDRRPVGRTPLSRTEMERRTKQDHGGWGDIQAEKLEDEGSSRVLRVPVYSTTVHRKKKKKQKRQRDPTNENY